MTKVFSELSWTLIKSEVIDNYNWKTNKKQAWVIYMYNYINTLVKRKISWKKNDPSLNKMNFPSHYMKGGCTFKNTRNWYTNTSQLCEYRQ